jgi:tRNA threonylcarbamoyladenosine biosynthesis protein TsaB
MIVLAIDTATPATVVGLRKADGAVLEARDDPRPGERPGHCTRLLPLAAGLLAEVGLRWSEIDRVAVGVGPGTFTGLRVGLATAQGLARSSEAELVGISSLAALAHGCAQREAGSGRIAAGEPTVLAAIDARRGEVFVAGYQQGMELLSPKALEPAAVPAAMAELGMLADSGPLAVGDGAVLYRDAFERAGASVPEDDSPLHRIGANALCELCVGAPASAGPLLPDYLRRPDAAIALEGAAS